MGERLHPSQDVSLFLWREEVVERYLYFSLSPFFFLFLTTLRGGGCGIAGPSRDTVKIGKTQNTLARVRKGRRKRNCFKG